ncbi:hypothetical protein HDU99_007524 [Rhizoclosmatium hyalinum]|nr:hypothetical protein HDU99_007524 [Rhizoclosmatium hyalinum]
MWVASCVSPFILHHAPNSKLAHPSNSALTHANNVTDQPSPPPTNRGLFNFFSSNRHDDHSQVYGENGQHKKGNFGHELLAGAAGFEAMRLFEQHEEAQGKVVKHKFFKDLLAGFAAAEAEKLFETHALGSKGIDKEEFKAQAVQNAHANYDKQYGHLE